MADTNSAAANTASSTDSLTSGGSAATASTGNAANTGTSYSGQAPDARTDERPGADGGARSPNAQSTDDNMTPEQYRAALKAANNEAAATRKARQAAEQELADLKRSLEDAKLSETEKLQKQYAEAQREIELLRLERQDIAVRSRVELTAHGMGIKPELALKLIDQNAIVFDDNGFPTNIRELIDKAMTDYGLAPASPAAAPAQRAAASPASATANGRAAAAQSGGATNPGAGRGPGVFTKQQIARMSPREYEANKAAIYEAMKNGQVR